MIEIYNPFIITYGKLILAWQRWKTTGGFDYDGYYRWYRHEYPAEYRRERWQAVAMLLDPRLWWRTIWR